MTSWIDSYQNHILHCSLYTAVAACSFRLSTIPLASVWNVIPLMFGGLATLSLCSEINYMIRRMRLPPGDSGIPFFGHILQIVGEGGARALKLDAFRKFKTPLVTVNALMNPVVMVKDEEDIRWWLIQERKGVVVPMLLPHLMNLLGHEAINLQHSADHRRLRKIFEPTFSPSAVRGYAEIVDVTTLAELQKWSARDGFCPSNDWAILAMRLFFICAFGKVDEDLMANLSHWFEIWTGGFSSPVPFALPGSRLKKAYAARVEMLNILKKMVADFKEENPPGSAGAEHGMMGRLCYGVDDDGKTLSESQLIVNILFILFAGHDTTKGSFCAFAYYLTEHPEIKRVLVEEVQTFSEPLDMDELKAAPLLNAFLAETWRLVPPLTSHNLRTSRDVKYKGYTFLKNTRISLDLQAYHVTDQDGRYPDPMEFRLDRWLPEDHPLHNPKYYLGGVDYNVPSAKYRPFSFGPHVCLGVHFAKLEARIALTRLLQKYDIEIENNTVSVIPLLQYNNDFKLTKR